VLSPCYLMRALCLWVVLKTSLHHQTNVTRSRIISIIFM